MKFLNLNSFLFITCLALINVSVILDFPYLRQIFGFLFLTIMPGFILIYGLGRSKLDFWNKFVLATGISISFVMFSGLFLSYFLSYIGYSRPLLANNLLIYYDVILLSVFFVCRKRLYITDISLPVFHLTPAEKIFLIIPILLPALSLIGMNELTENGNNIILIAMLILISLYIITISFMRRRIPNRLYIPIILLISISLSLLFELRSTHIMGVDRHLEYLIYKNTLDNLYWSNLYHTSLDSCLSISLLPAVYQSFLNWDIEYLSKYLIPIIFSITPLMIFIISKRYVDDIYAFLAAFFFMSQHLFVYFTGGRTNLAIFFVALIIMVLFSHKLEIMEKRILLIIFLSSCIASHYATTYLLFINFLIVAMIMKVFVPKYNPAKNINPYLILIFFIIMFLWYAIITETPFSTGIGFIEVTLVSMTKSASEELLSNDVSNLIGINIAEKSIPSKIEFVLTWLILAFIGGGVFCMTSWYLLPLFKKIGFPFHNLFFDRRSLHVPVFIRMTPDIEFVLGSIIFTAMLFFTLAIPYLSTGYDISRTFFLTVIYLAVFFIAFGLVISDVIFKIFQNILNVSYDNRLAQFDIRHTISIIILLSIIVPFFLCSTGVLYNIFGANRELIINSEKDLIKIRDEFGEPTQFDTLFITERESDCGKWLQNKGNLSLKLYVDYISSIRLISQAATLNLDGYSLAQGKRINDGYIVLSPLNIIEDKLIDENRNFQSTSSILDNYRYKNIIYSNDGSQIWL